MFLKKISDKRVEQEILHIISSLNPIKDQIRRVIGTHPLSKVVIAGHSMGGIMAWLVANQLSHNGPNGRIGALITSSSPFLWLDDKLPFPKHVVVSTPTEDCHFKACFNPCWDKLNSRIVVGYHKRYSDIRNHDDLSEAFKQDSAIALLNVHWSLQPKLI